MLMDEINEAGFDGAYEPWQREDPALHLMGNMMVTWLTRN